jgi:polynucleotide 5'-hydroxyl-kinase GRC3/NOL9
MAEDWAYNAVEGLLRKGPMGTGVFLLLGGADTGKTTLAEALSGRLAGSRPVGIVDADVGQSHIGPPGTVGWAVIDKPPVDFARLTPGGISFVGDVTPVGHLLQWTAAVVQSLKLLSRVARLAVIDTPGFVTGGAAKALWWTIDRMLKPDLILAVERGEELGPILTGLQRTACRIERVRPPADIRLKSPDERRRYRKRRFEKYFENSRIYDIDLTDTPVQSSEPLDRRTMAGRLVGLRDEQGFDVAVGLVKDYNCDRNFATVAVPQIDIEQVRCIVVGDVTVDLGGV